MVQANLLAAGNGHDDSGGESALTIKTEQVRIGTSNNYLFLPDSVDLMGVPILAAALALMTIARDICVLDDESIKPGRQPSEFPIDLGWNRLQAVRDCVCISGEMQNLSILR